MTDFKRIMVGLDLTPTDETLIHYTFYLSKLISPQKIYFFHIEENLEIPEEIMETYQVLKKPLDETLENKLEKQVKKYLPGKAKIDYEVEVIEGNALKKLLHWAHLKDVDLMVVGRKKEKDGRGIVPRKLARKITCSSLFVPSKTAFRIKRIHVGVDFSSHSKTAIKEAAKIARRSGALLVCHHVYEIPTGYYTTGKSYEEFSEIMKSNAREKFKKFSRELSLSGINMKTMFTLSDKKELAHHIVDLAGEKGADLIVMGSLGKNAASALLLGSVAESLVKWDSDIPLLIIKNKNETLGFLEALMKI